MKNFNVEMIEKAKAAKSAEELLELAKANNVEMTADEAKTYFAQLGPKSGELNDDDLDAVAGGGCNDDERQRENEDKVIHTIVCPKCGALGNWSVYHTCQGGYVWKCNVCKVRGVLEESDNYSVMHTNRLS